MDFYVLKMCASHVTLVVRFEQNSNNYNNYLLKDNTTQLGVNELQNMFSLSLEELGHWKEKDLKTYISSL